jgi:hypothetical protein
MGIYFVPYRKKLGGQKNMDTTAVRTDCNSSGCENSASTVLSGQDLCLDHFFASCYQQLDKLEPKLRRGALLPAETSEARIFLEECSNRVLYISLRSVSLTNLERSRLLEILLSCGDLQNLLRRPTIHRPTNSGHSCAAHGAFSHR